jgi:hypothetical protein
MAELYSGEVPSLPVARLSIHGVELFVVFVDEVEPAARKRIYTELAPSRNVAAVWRDQYGRTRFIAPPEQHPFLEIAGYDQLRAQTNGAVSV